MLDLKPVLRRTRPRASLRLLFVVVSVTLMCLRSTAFQNGLLQRLDRAAFSLVEIGAFSSFRTLRLTEGVFRVHENAEFSVLDGVSANGDALVFSVVSGRHSSLVHSTDGIDVVNIDGTVKGTFRPPIKGLSAIYAELSPAGEFVVFAGTFGAGNSDGLHLLGRDGSGRTLVKTTESGLPRSIGWSKDGGKIVYDSAETVFIYDIASGASKALVSGDTPTWSPDGMWIACRRPDRSGQLISPDGLHVRSILTGVRIAGALRWSPDGKYLLFTDETAAAIRIVELEGGETETVLSALDGKTDIRLRWVKGFPGQSNKR